MFSPLFPTASSLPGSPTSAPGASSGRPAAPRVGDQSVDGLAPSSASGSKVDAMEEQPSGLNIADTIFRELRRQILVGELSAGQRLPGERDLATQYGTNRNTLREAVRKLEQARLVTVR